MTAIKTLFSNYPLVSAGIGWCLAQILKIFTNLFQTKSLDIKMLISSGGMPSSHSATVAALTIACALQHGLMSTEFGIAFVLAAVVMRDAAGVRWETGEQAKLINKMMNEIFSGKPEEINSGLKELVGHTPFQVIVGAVLGVLIAFAMWPVYF